MWWRRRKKDPEAERLWWERTWKEREDLFHATYGESYGEDGRPGMVAPFAASLRVGLGFRDGLAGGCVMGFRPQRGMWKGQQLYVTHGLTQPVSSNECAAKRPSRYGLEFGIVVPEPADWVPHALMEMAAYAVEADQRIEPGSRFPLEFQASSEFESGLAAALGGVEDEGSRVGEMRSLVLWPGLDRDECFATSTGTFDLLIATTITGKELELAKETTSLHVLHLLQLAGVGQSSDPLRRSPLDEPQWEREWERIAKVRWEDLVAAVYDNAEANRS